MTSSGKAIYEHGVLRLIEPVDLPEGATVDVVITHFAPAPGPAEAARTLAALAALPIERAADGFSARDHDQVLYGRGV